ncbi:MAG: hypothetical protein AAFQ43_05580 [Bacteroidota bacterium]
MIATPTLARTSHGTVCRLAGTADLDLRFGETGLRVSPPQLRRMCDTIERARRRPDASRGWAFRAATERESVVFRLPGDDVQAFGDLLAAAVQALDLDALVLDSTAPRATA